MKSAQLTKRKSEGIRYINLIPNINEASFLSIPMNFNIPKYTGTRAAFKVIINCEKVLPTSTKVDKICLADSNKAVLCGEAGEAWVISCSPYSAGTNA